MMSSCRALHVSQNEGFPGTMIFHHPVKFQQKYQARDADFRTACCEIGFDDRYYCSKYFEWRVVNDCQQPQSYSPPKLGNIMLLIIEACMHACTAPDNNHFDQSA